MTFIDNLIQYAGHLNAMATHPFLLITEDTIWEESPNTKYLFKSLTDFERIKKATANSRPSRIKREEGQCHRDNTANAKRW